jgi:hypothetical protein
MQPIYILARILLVARTPFRWNRPAPLSHSAWSGPLVHHLPPPAPNSAATAFMASLLPCHAPVQPSSARGAEPPHASSVSPHQAGPPRAFLHPQDAQATSTHPAAPPHQVGPPSVLDAYCTYFLVSIYRNAC